MVQSPFDISVGDQIVDDGINCIRMLGNNRADCAKEQRFMIVLTGEIVQIARQRSNDHESIVLSSQCGCNRLVEFLLNSRIQT